MGLIKPLCKMKKTHQLLVTIFVLGIVFIMNSFSLIAASDKTKPTITLKTSSSSTNSATISVTAKDASGINEVKWASGSQTTSYFTKNGNSLQLTKNNTTNVVVDKNDTYTFYAKDTAGNKTVKKITISSIEKEEMQAVWISYLEFDTFRSKNANNINASTFKTYFDTVFDKCKSMNFNTVIVQVRPFSDAIYPSSYFPWSYSITGTQGKDPGFDPLQILIDSAHERGLEFHAWINPYRVTGDGKNNNIAAMSKDNQGKKWYNSTNTSTKRNVLLYGGKLYYNPSKTAVQTLIVNGVKEIIDNYNVDGIHLDDYFYPGLGSKYKTNFDATEYNSYVSTCKKNGTSPKDIVSWRRSNVNKLVKKLYATVKEKDPNLIFGISPQGNMNNLYAKEANYVDVKTWMKSDDYIDYICPQIYWSFDYTPNTYAFDTVLDQWMSVQRSNSVKLYVGIAAYKAGSSATSSAVVNSKGQIIDAGWLKSTNQIAKQIEYSRATGQVEGFALFRYDFLLQSKLKNEITNFKKLFQ